MGNNEKEKVVGDLHFELEVWLQTSRMGLELESLQLPDLSPFHLPLNMKSWKQIGLFQNRNSFEMAWT